MVLMKTDFTSLVLESTRRPTRKGAPASPRAWVIMRWMAWANDLLAGVMT